MNIITRQYETKENALVKSFHRTRRMFCIYQGKLRIAAPNLAYSHTTWFENEGWISKADQAPMNKITRGIVDPDGNIHFYIGFNFHINKLAEIDFFPHLGELVKKLKLTPSAQIFGGAKKSKLGEIWPSIKNYGEIQANFKNNPQIL